MKAAVISGADKPVYLDFACPTPKCDGVVVEVRAAALTNLDIAVAERRHYFTPSDDKFILGREGVADVPGRGRCFLTATSIVGPFGSMAEKTLIRPQYALPVPDCVSDVEAAGVGNAGLAAWLPLSWRGRLRSGEVVLILGATGMSGLIAVFAAKRMGAKRVIAVGRNSEALSRARELGADATVSLKSDCDLATAFREAAGGTVDLVLDYLNGAPAEAALKVMAPGGRMVQIGSILAPNLLLNAQRARQGSLDVLGFAYYHAPLALQADAYMALCHEIGRDALPLQLTRMPLSHIDEAWDRMKQGETSRLVLTPERVLM
jgi:NADPH:quinone reductase-like Zn-dependent oxidoreductase